MSSLLKSSAAILLAKMLTITLSFLIIPLVIHKLGLQAYGSWETFLAIGTVANMLNAVISGSVLWLVSQAHGKGNHKIINEVLSNAIFLWLVLAVISVGASIVFSANVAKLFGVGASSTELTPLLIPAIVFAFALSGLSDIFAAVISGQQRSGSAHLIQACAVVAGGITSVSLLILWPTITALFIGQALNFSCAILGLVYLLRSIDPNVRLRPKPPTKQLLIQAAAYSGFILLGVFSTVLRDQTDRLLLATSGSSVVVANYAVANRLAAILLILCTFFYTPAVAAAGRLYGAGRYEELSELYAKLCRASLIVVGAATVVIAGLADQIFIIWLGDPYPQAQKILHWLLLANFSAVLFTAIGTAIGKGTGLIKPETAYIAIGVTANLILKFLLFPQLGGVGAVMSSAISWVLSSLVFLWLFHKYSATPANTAWRLVAGAVAVVLSVAALRITIPMFIAIQQSRVDALRSMPALIAVALLLFASSLILTRAIKLTELGALAAALSRRLTGAPRL